MGADLRYFLALLKINGRAAMSRRAAYLIRGFLGFLTHSVYILVWFVFFAAVPRVGGWGLEHLLLAYGISVAAWGIVASLAYGFRTLPEQIDNGELDVYLTQPRPVLLNVAMGTSKAAGLGEIVFGLGLIGYSASIAGFTLPAAALAVVCAALIFASIALATASLGFWLRDFRGTSEELILNFSILSSRPAPLFTGWMKFMLMTVIPVSFMTHVPIEFIMNHRVDALLATLAGTVFSTAAAYGLFSFGLRRYESGNRFAVRG